MKLVCAVNDRGKVWEIKKVAERFVLSHQHKEFYTIKELSVVVVGVIIGVYHKIVGR